MCTFLVCRVQNDGFFSRKAFQAGVLTCRLFVNADSQEGGFTGGALSEEEAEVRVAGLWDRVRSIIRHSLQMASGTVQATMQQHRRAQQLNHQAFEFVRYDFMADRQLQPWLIEVNMSPNMIPHDGEAHQDTQWRVAILQQVAALAAGHPEAVPGATLLTGDALPATATAGGGGEQQQVGVRVAAFDFDDCVAQSGRQGGPTWSGDAKDWRMKFAHVPQVMRHLHEAGYMIAVLSNESMVRLKQETAIHNALTRKLGRIEAWA